MESIRLSSGTWRLAFDAIGAPWHIDTPSSLTERVLARIAEQMKRFDAIYSRFRDDSLVSVAAHATKGGVFNFTEDCATMFEVYDKLFTCTQGAIDPLVGRDLELLGYGPGYSLTADYASVVTHAVDRPNWERDVQRQGCTLITRRPLVIDFGAAGKGCLVDLIARVLRSASIESFVIDGSGDLRHGGRETLRVGLEHPLHTDRVIGVAEIADQALCASATNRRVWGDGLHHVLDARTGQPVRDVIATWVIADSALVADALATALFLTSPERLAAAFDFQFVRMFADGTAERSVQFAGEIFTETGAAS